MIVNEVAEQSSTPIYIYIYRERERERERETSVGRSPMSATRHNCCRGMPISGVYTLAFDKKHKNSLQGSSCNYNLDFNTPQI